jgi:hypothetical protein
MLRIRAGLQAAQIRHCTDGNGAGHGRFRNAGRAASLGLGIGLVCRIRRDVDGLANRRGSNASASARTSERDVRWVQVEAFEQGRQVRAAGTMPVSTVTYWRPPVVIGGASTGDWASKTTGVRRRKPNMR